MKSIVILLLITLSTISCSSGIPIAIFHGIGDSCSNGGMDQITKYFGRKVGAYSVCIETAGGFFDFVTSFESQYENACKQVKADPNLQGEFSVVGLSQGALLARAIIQRCDMKGRVKRFVSIGGPQAGVAKIPQCTWDLVCWPINFIADKLVYFYLVQHFVGPAGYFKNPGDFTDYQKYSSFLANLNNEVDNKNPEYKERMINLDKVVLIKFNADTMILPGETAWFSFYDANQNLVNYKDTELYKQDFVGIKTLDERGAINFASLPGNHLNFSYSDIDRLMIPALQ